MEILKEITKWDCDYVVPNHVYLFNDSGNVIAYFNAITQKVDILKTPLKINKRYRKFIQTSNPELQKLIPSETEEGVSKYKVFSKEKEYMVIVKNNSYRCNCMGYTYRGTCKHIDAVKEQM